MKRIWLILGILAGLFLTGCNAKAEPVQTTDADNSSSEAPCYFGACIKNAYASVDDEYFIVLFDVTPSEGISDASMAPQFTTPLTIKVEGVDGTEYVNQVFTQEDYYCYVGKDVPWAVGQNTAICGIGIEIGPDTLVPAVDDQIIVTLPEYGDYQLELEVGSSL
jgi:hypothetical protein